MDGAKSKVTPARSKVESDGSKKTPARSKGTPDGSQVPADEGKIATDAGKVAMAGDEVVRFNGPSGIRTPEPMDYEGGSTQNTPNEGERLMVV